MRGIKSEGRNNTSSQDLRPGLRLWRPMGCVPFLRVYDPRCTGLVTSRRTLHYLDVAPGLTSPATIVSPLRAVCRPALSNNRSTLPGLGTLYHAKL